MHTKTAQALFSHTCRDKTSHATPRLAIAGRQTPYAREEVNDSDQLHVVVTLVVHICELLLLALPPLLYALFVFVVDVGIRHRFDGVIVKLEAKRDAFVERLLRLARRIKVSFLL